MLTLNSIIKVTKRENSFGQHNYNYDLGWIAYSNGEPYQDEASVSWQTGWLDAQDAENLSNETSLA